MKTYNQLTLTQQEKAIKLAVNRVLTDIVEHGIRFDDEKNGDDLQARIDKACARAEEMQTPWFAHEYIYETCKEDIEGLALPIAEDAIYLEHETAFELSEVSK